MNIFIIIIAILLVLYLFFAGVQEHFQPLKETDGINLQVIIPKNMKLKDDRYMDFLQDLDFKFKEKLDELNVKQHTTNLPFKQKVLCDDRLNKQTQSEALDYAFSKQPNYSKSELTDKKILNTNDPQITFDFQKKYLKGEDLCVHKASSLCERSNPMYYLSETRTFPPRWIFKPYENMELPQHVDLNCFNRMYNCCKKKF
jgi:hypothetical protein